MSASSNSGPRANSGLYQKESEFDETAERQNRLNALEKEDQMSVASNQRASTGLYQKESDFDKIREFASLLGQEGRGVRVLGDDDIIAATGPWRESGDSDEADGKIDTLKFTVALLFAAQSRYSEYPKINSTHRVRAEKLVDGLETIKEREMKIRHILGRVRWVRDCDPHQGLTAIEEQDLRTVTRQVKRMAWKKEGMTDVELVHLDEALRAGLILARDDKTWEIAMIQPSEELVGFAVRCRVYAVEERVALETAHRRIKGNRSTGASQSFREALKPLREFHERPIGDIVDVEQQEASELCSWYDTKLQLSDTMLKRLWEQGM